MRDCEWLQSKRIENISNAGYSFEMFERMIFSNKIATKHGISVLTKEFSRNNDQITHLTQQKSVIKLVEAFKILL